VPRSLAIDGAGVPVQAVHPFNASPITPSARISALNIVGDLLRKVGVSNKGVSGVIVCVTFTLSVSSAGLRVEVGVVQAISQQ